jgi:Inorganic pyrophosphatase
MELHRLPARNESGEWNVVVDTPRASRIKYKFNLDSGLFELSKVLPAGHSFPFNFGFIPGTLGGDGDPLDVLLLLEESVALGCVVSTRLIGVIEAKQKEDGKTQRNERLIGVANEDLIHCDCKSIREVPPRLLEEIEHFFVSYNLMQGREFRPTGRGSARRAQQIACKGMQ